MFENNPSDNIHQKHSKVLYVTEENADNREDLKLTLDTLYSDLGIHKILNYLVVVGDAKTYDLLVHLKNDFPFYWRLAYP